MDSVGSNPSHPQEKTRCFGFDKALTRKVSRVVAEDDMVEAVSYMPGRLSIIHLVQVCKDAGPNDDLGLSVTRHLSSLRSWRGDAVVTDPPLR